MNQMNALNPTSSPAMDEWYVYQETGQHVGPVTLDLLARGITAGKVPRTAYAGLAGDGRWRPVLEIPEVSAAVRSLETPPPPAVVAAPQSVRPPLPSRIPSSVAPPAPPIGFVTPPRVTQVSDAAPTTPDATIPAPSLFQPQQPQMQQPQQIQQPQTQQPQIQQPQAQAPQSLISSSAPTARAPSNPQVPAAPPATNGASSVWPMQAAPPAPAPAPMVAAAAAPTMQVQQVPTPAPAAQAPAAAPAQAKSAPAAKPEETKDPLDPKFRFLPFAIFGACAFFAGIEAVVGLLIH